jgi:two-component system alkaline phosphatase synthesis response regulator PhoP
MLLVLMMMLTLDFARSSSSNMMVPWNWANLDPAIRTVHRDGQPVALSSKEFDLLLALIQRRGTVVSRPDLMTSVWGYQTDVLSRTVDTHIAELRRKLEVDPSAPRHILTVRKVGYRIQF